MGISEFTITDIKRSEHEIRYYVEKTDKPKVCPHFGVCKPTVAVYRM
ncbi:MAG: hypothetical protein N2645_14290 [Clostridia bacterium]|nr:hypothetical protein [Clostridia bacterium]